MQSMIIFNGRHDFGCKRHLAAGLEILSQINLATLVTQNCSIDRLFATTQSKNFGFDSVIIGCLVFSSELSHFVDKPLMMKTRKNNCVE
jgi:hypothetical protein